MTKQIRQKPDEDYKGKTHKTDLGATGEMWGRIDVCFLELHTSCNKIAKEMQEQIINGCHICVLTKADAKMQRL